MSNEIKSKKYPGVFFRDLENGDRSYFLRIRLGGKIKRFAIGKKSEGITEAFCNQEKIRIINEFKFGNDNPISVKKVSENKPTFVDIVNFYVKTSTNTESYKREISFLKNKKIAKIDYPTKKDISEFILSELSIHKPQTVNIRLKHLRSVYKHAIAMDFYKGSNPTEGIKTFKGEGVRRRILSKEEIEMILNKLKNNNRYYLFVKLSLCTGARLGTITRIHSRDINEDGSVTLYNEKIKRYYTGFLDAETMDLIRDKQGYVLSLKGKENKMPCKNTISRGVKAILDELFENDKLDPLDRVVIHTFRHSVATRMVERGVPMEVISRTLDHASLSTTAKYYAKISHDVVRKSVTNIWE